MQRVTPYDPDPAVIAAALAEIRANWTPDEFEFRLDRGANAMIELAATDGHRSRIEPGSANRGPANMIDTDTKDSRRLRSRLRVSRAFGAADDAFPVRTGERASRRERCGIW